MGYHDDQYWDSMFNDEVFNNLDERVDDNSTKQIEQNFLFNTKITIEGFEPQKEKDNMSNTAEVRRRALEIQMNEAAMELARMELLEERFGTNSDYENNTILRWEQRYNDNGRMYSFVAIKCAGFWYTSGMFQHHRYSFDELLERHLSKADGIWIVTEMKELG